MGRDIKALDPEDKRLTARQELFAIKVVITMTREAYRIAYPNSRKWEPESVWKKASRLAGTAHVKRRIRFLQKQATEAHGLSKDSALLQLADVALHSENDNARVRAATVIGEHCDLTWTQPTKTKVNVNVSYADFLRGLNRPELKPAIVERQLAEPADGLEDRIKYVRRLRIENKSYD
jgi:hypothetical protein